MNDLRDLIAPEAILPRVIATSRRQALPIMADTLAKLAGVDARTAFDAILMRERLSGPGMGDGVRFRCAVAGVTRPWPATLDPAQDFDARRRPPISCSCCSPARAAPIT
jgi:PTS system nitrogen regulatory IIA component